MAGRGYVGIFNHGTTLVFPPLFPLMIAAVSLVVRNAELAARAVNIVFGAALVVPMYRLAEEFYGQKTARIVAALVVLLGRMRAARPYGVRWFD